MQTPLSIRSDLAHPSFYSTTSPIFQLSTIQPSLLPLYLPLWQYAQLSNNINPNLLLHPSSLLSPTPPSDQSAPSQFYPAPLARTHAGRRSSAHSPERFWEGGHGSSSNRRQTRRGARVSVTSRDPVATMPARSLDIAHTALPSRPPLSQAKSSVSHQSNSVPSTPQQHARNLTFRSRSPSPDDQSTSHSPRSTHSEPNKQFTSGGRTPIGCRFETGMAFSKRRIPYSIGTDKLESVHPPPKLTLAPADEARLSRDMQDLYQRHLLPSAESEARRRSFLRKLADLLNKEWPHGQIEVKLFGSSGNLLCTSDSDGQCSSIPKCCHPSSLTSPVLVDLCITTPLKELEQVCLLAKALDKRTLDEIFPVTSPRHR